MLKYSFYLLLLAGLLNLAFSAPSLFETGGAIKGSLQDKATKEAIPYANIVLFKEQVQVGVATTNIDGEFTFKNLAPGKYSVKGIYVGYKPQMLNHIVVKDQKTTWITLSLDNGEGVKLDEIEVQTYSPPLIDPDTKANSTVTREEYQDFSVKDINSVHGTTAGVYQGDKEKKLSMRGGRSTHETEAYAYWPANAMNAEEYNAIKDNVFKNAQKEPLSTFSIDVDKAAYSNVRRYINQGSLPPADAVRIEELINYFSYNYPQPKANKPFSISTQYVECP